MDQHRGMPTPDERARIGELQDLLIDVLSNTERRWQKGKKNASKQWRPKSDSLLSEKEEIEKLAVAGST
jgi:hypothetical protein